MDTHNKAQALAVEADLLRREGRLAEARERFAEAATFERQALAEVPAGKPRTFGILAVSLVALLYKAKDFAAAEREAHKLLGREEALPPDAGRQIRELIEAIWDERALPAGQEYSGDEIVVSLRGGTVGVGTAPLEALLDEASAVRNLVIRTVELTAHAPFRRKGPSEPRFSALVGARATQPTVGSYRFTIKLTSPSQPDLFQASPAPAAVADLVFAAIKASTSATRDERRELERVIPDKEYRRAIVNLIRGVLPRRGGPNEVELLRRVKGATGEESRESVILGPGNREFVRSAAQELTPPKERQDAKAVQVRGILRALDLDQDWLIVDAHEGKRYEFLDAKEVIDDVVGPMVNRSVVVDGFARLRAGKEEYLFGEISADDESTDAR